MKALKSLTILVLLAAIVSCSPVKVVVDVDKTVDFSQYDTYKFLGWQENSDKIFTDFDKKRMHDAFKSELEARNLTLDQENGTLAISLFIVVDQKTSTTAYTDYYGSGGYGGYNRYGGGWGHGSSTTTYSESDYLEGTLVMDVFDSSSKDQIWQGVATGTITENPAKRDKTIPAKVAALMKKYPVQPE